MLTTASLTEPSVEYIFRAEPTIAGGVQADAGSITVNGVAADHDVEPRVLPVLRETLGLTGPKAR